MKNIEQTERDLVEGSRQIATLGEYFACLHYFNSDVKLQLHAVDCGEMNDCAIRLPSDKDKWLEFNNYNRKERLTFVVYADLECVLAKTEKEQRQKLYQHHQVFSIAYYVLRRRCPSRERRSRGVACKFRPIRYLTDLNFGTERNGNTNDIKRHNTKFYNTKRYFTVRHVTVGTNPAERANSASPGGSWRPAINGTSTKTLRSNLYGMLAALRRYLETITPADPGRKIVMLSVRRLTIIDVDGFLLGSSPQDRS
ncbi:hypothetical protein EAG_07449 [Camponotus floridanus]|uniref:Uncharacterized protein n=1 Tax=Camponotus floridanus TaxID=104421 RepID=E2AN56_CAMFO|nr:hypothetical protein EAG_07449 [Camponotus floridanus]